MTTIFPCPSGRNSWLSGCAQPHRWLRAAGWADPDGVNFGGTGLELSQAALGLASQLVAWGQTASRCVAWKSGVFFFFQVCNGLYNLEEDYLVGIWNSELLFLKQRFEDAPLRASAFDHEARFLGSPRCHCDLIQAPNAVAPNSLVKALLAKAMHGSYVHPKTI